MGNVNVTRLGDAAQADHELDYSERIGRAPVEADPFRAPTRPRGADIIAMGAVAGLGWLGLLLVLGAWRAILCWETCYGTQAGLALALIWLWLTLPIIGAVAFGIVAAAMAWRNNRAAAARIAVTRDRFGNPVSAEAVLRQSPAEAWRALALATEADVQVAPHRIYRGVDALSLAGLPQPQNGAALAVAAADVLVDAPDTWLAWLNERPHLMLAAETGGGKSVMAGVVVAQRARLRGDEVAILDPHWSPRVTADEGRTVPKWGGIAPAAQSHTEIRDALISLRSLYDTRLAQLRNGEVMEGGFPWLTVVIDEVPEVVKALKSLDKRGTDTWGATTEVLGSGARKVNINVILLTQSPLVEDIGMNSAMRKNFYRVTLAADQCRRLFAEEQDKARREALHTALKGRPYPAALERKGEIWLVNRDGVLDRLPERIEAAAWRPTVCNAPSSRPSGPHGRTDAEKVAILRALRNRGLTRDQARISLHRIGIEFSNDLWTEAGSNG